VPGIEEGDAEKQIATRHASWAKRLPEEIGNLWNVIAAVHLDA